MKIDPEKTLFDLISFDGAGNVQNPGALMEQHVCRCTVIMGIEHTVLCSYLGRSWLSDQCKRCASLPSWLVMLLMLHYFLVEMLAIINIYFIYFYSSEMYSDQPNMLPIQ